MNKIQQNKTEKNMHLHNAKTDNALTEEEINDAFEYIDKYLPEHYITKVMFIYPEVSKTTIHNVRNRKVKKISNHADVVHALVRVAQNNKESVEKARSLISEINN